MKKLLLLSVFMFVATFCVANNDCTVAVNKTVQLGELTIVFKGSTCDFEEFVESGYNESVLHKSYSKTIEGNVIVFKHKSYR